MKGSSRLLKPRRSPSPALAGPASWAKEAPPLPGLIGAIAAAVFLCFACNSSESRVDPGVAQQLREIRNLGKAFYESPGSAQQAVETLARGVELAPESPRERINYGLALLRAGKIAEGIAELEQAQQADPSIPHTYFNLGVEYKKTGEAEKALAQFNQMAELTPNEAKVHYNRGQLLKQLERIEEATAAFERAAELDPSLAAPHFQLYNQFRRSDPERARAALEEFKRIKALQEKTGLDEDVDWSFYAELYDPPEPIEPIEAPDELRFETSQLGQAAGAQPGVLLLDANADRRPDALVWTASGAKLFVNGEAFAETPLPAGGLRAADAGDANNDGYPDLCLAGASGATLLLNQNGAFDESRPLASGQFESCLWHDFDHDGDLDVFLLGADSHVLRNRSDATFDPAEFPFVPGRRALGAVAVELLEDNSIDLIAVYEDGVVVYEDRKLGRYDRAAELEVEVPARPRIEAVDVDNDGYLDVVVSGENGSRLLENRGGRLEPGGDLPPALTFGDFANRGQVDLVTPDGAQMNGGEGEFNGISANGLPATLTAAASADFGGDGQADLIAVTADGAVVLARNRTQTDGGWATVSLKGVKSAVLAEGARVEIKAGPIYRKRISEGFPLHFGLNGAQAIETVRITWPNGLIQNETRQPIGQALAYEEKPRLSGSCPMIFTWNGERFEYISEVLGVAPLGASLGDGRFFPVDHDEYVWIDGERLRARDGLHEVRITEELREVAYLDRIQLLAVDHPQDLEIYTNEKFKAPPFPEFRLFEVQAKEKIRPIRAVDHRGRDVLARLTERDARYADGFERTFRNTAEPHSVTLEFPETGATKKLRLFLTGWVDWADASTIVAAAQTAHPIEPPRLEVRDAAGRWRTAVADLGLPGGSPRTMSVELPAGTREIRIATNMCVYWDEIFVAPSAEAAAGVTRLDPIRADLRFRGFSENVRHPERKQPESFNYAMVRPVSNWNPTAGRYTRYGDTLPLLRAEDDRLTVMGAGDELQLAFRADDFPPLPAGWRRDFLLYVDGWAKENEANTAFGDSVEPLPFHAMAGYPTEDRPSDLRYAEYLREYQRRPALRLLRPLR